MPIHITIKTLLLFTLLLTTTGWALAHGEHQQAEQAAQTTQAPPPKQADIVITDGWVTTGPSVTRVKQGEQVQLSFLSNHADELHLHGYDITVALTPGHIATLAFTATYPGRFSYELHQAHREIGAIEVYPK